MVATTGDLPGAAFAGQPDAFLNVLGEQAVIRAMVDYWASLRAARAIAHSAACTCSSRGQ